MCGLVTYIILLCTVIVNGKMAVRDAKIKLVGFHMHHPFPCPDGPFSIIRNKSKKGSVRVAKRDTLAKVSDFGMAVKIRLIEMQKTQDWLIEQVKERTGDYFDSSYLHRILTGKLPAENGHNGKPGKAEVIREILGLEG